MESTGNKAKSMDMPAMPPANADTKASLKLKWCAQTIGFSAIVLFKPLNYNNKVGGMLTIIFKDQTNRESTKTMHKVSSILSYLMLRINIAPANAADPRKATLATPIERIPSPGKVQRSAIQRPLNQIPAKMALLIRKIAIVEGRYDLGFVIWNSALRALSPRKLSCISETP